MSDTDKIIRVALTGPESSGKTSLCTELSAHFKTVFVPEYSREYMENLDRKYSIEDVCHCIRKQNETDREMMQEANKLLFSDTENIMAKVWLEDVFKESPAWVESLIQNQNFDLYFLTMPDLPFVEDPVRENPTRRDFFYRWYERELMERKFPYEIIKGSGEIRIKNAIQLIEKHFPQFIGKHSGPTHQNQ